MAPSRRALVTLIDQGFSSGSNFAVGAVIARVAGPTGLGAYAFAYASWIVVASLHRSLITDPMAIEGDVRHTIRYRGIERGFAAEVILGVGSIAAFVLIGVALLALHAHSFAYAMLSLAPWLPVLLLQDYWRWVGFMRRKPGQALSNDAVFNVVQAVGFTMVILGHVDSVAALLTCWGAGAAAGAAFGLLQHHTVPTLRGGRALLRERWQLSKWLVGTSMTSLGGYQLYTIIAGAILGPAGLGSLKAAQTLVSGPSGVLVQAGGSIGLPEASKAYEDQGWSGLTKVSRVVGGAGFLTFLGTGIIVFIWGQTLLTAVYGPQFAHLETALRITAVAYFLISFYLGTILVLKTTRNTNMVFRVQMLTMVTMLTSVSAFSVLWGVNGACAAMVVTYGTSAIGNRWLEHRVRREAGVHRVRTRWHLFGTYVGPKDPATPTPLQPPTAALARPAPSSSGSPNPVSDEVEALG